MGTVECLQSLLVIRTISEFLMSLGVNAHSYYHSVRCDLLCRPVSNLQAPSSSDSSENAGGLTQSEHRHLHKMMTEQISKNKSLKV